LGSATKPLVGLRKDNFMLLLEALFVFGISVWTVWHLCDEHVTCGKKTKDEKGVPTFTVATGLVLISVLSYSLPHYGPMVIALAAHVIVRGLLYFWYVGSLSGVRRRHVEKMQKRWDAKFRQIIGDRLASGTVIMWGPCDLERPPDITQREYSKLRRLRWRLKNIYP